MFEPSRRSATVFIAVKTGAITTSQWFALATRGFSARAVSTAWLSVLYIFQFPAITGLRIQDSQDFQDEEDLFIRERSHTRQFVAREKLKRGAAARGDVRDLVGDTCARDGGHGVAAADD